MDGEPPHLGDAGRGAPIETDRDAAPRSPRDRILGMARAAAEEFRAGHLLLRCTARDLRFDADRGLWTIDPDLPRYPIDEPPTDLSLLDNGIYAPELTKRIQRPLSPRTDVYSLGASIYYDVTGLEPIAEFWRLAENLPPVRIFDADLPLGLDPVLRCALARFPDDRFEDPQEFLAALELILETDRRREEPSRASLAIELGVATHGGINKSVRNPRNQDQSLCIQDSTGRLGLCLVADGVSTCDIGSGDRAAEHVTRAARQVWLSRIDGAPLVPPETWDLAGVLAEVFARAHEAIVQDVLDLHPEPIPAGRRPMSSTAVAVLRRGAEVCIGNLGDSRVYLVRDEWIDQVTVDGDRRTDLLRRGRGLDAIVNASGLGELVAAAGRFTAAEDRIVPVPPRGEFTSLHLLPGESLLICSDGVPDCIGADAESRIHTIVTRGDHPARAAWNLLVAANERGGDDNITAILMTCADDPARER